jgi:hypothetical protein
VAAPVLAAQVAAQGLASLQRLVSQRASMQRQKVATLRQESGSRLQQSATRRRQWRLAILASLKSLFAWNLAAGRSASAASVPKLQLHLQAMQQLLRWKVSQQQSATQQQAQQASHRCRISLREYRLARKAAHTQ